MPILTICIYSKDKQEIYVRDSIEAAEQLAASVHDIKYQDGKFFSDKTSSLHYYIKMTNDAYYCLAIPAKEATKDSVINHFNQIVAAHKQRNLLKLDSLVAQSQSKKIEALRKDLDDTKAILGANIDKVIARGDELEKLISRTEALTSETVTFRPIPKAKSKSSFSLKNLFICKSPTADDDAGRKLLPQGKSYRSP